MNKTILTGNLTRDPEGGTTASGIAWCRFSLAVNRQYKGQNGQQLTDFFTVVAWRGLANTCLQYLAKGRKCGVIGHLENRSWDGNDGTKHYATEVIADEVEFLTPKGNASQQAYQDDESDY